MTLFVIGVNGQLGHDMMIELNKRGYRCIGSDAALTYTGPIDFDTALEYVPLDCGDRDAVKRALKDINPTAVIDFVENSAVVDTCEELGVAYFQLDKVKNISESVEVLHRFLSN